MSVEDDKLHNTCSCIYTEDMFTFGTNIQFNPGTLRVIFTLLCRIVPFVWYLGSISFWQHYNVPKFMYLSYYPGLYNTIKTEIKSLLFLNKKASIHEGKNS